MMRGGAFIPIKDSGLAGKIREQAEILVAGFPTILRNPFEAADGCRSELHFAGTAGQQHFLQDMANSPQRPACLLSRSQFEMRTGFKNQEDNASKI